MCAILIPKEVIAVFLGAVLEAQGLRQLSIGKPPRVHGVSDHANDA
jgi:hypothetical protein